MASHSLYGWRRIPKARSPTTPKGGIPAPTRRCTSIPSPGLAGNSKLADRFSQKIANTYRLCNPYDIVPHVWEPGEIKMIPDLYDDQLTALRIPVDALAWALEVGGAVYQHEGALQHWSGGAVARSNFMQRAAIEHLDMYLTELGIYQAGTFSTLALFAPIR